MKRLIVIMIAFNLGCMAAGPSADPAPLLLGTGPQASADDAADGQNRSDEQQNPMGPQNSAAQAGDGDEQEEGSFRQERGEQPQPVNGQRRNGPPNIVLIFADDLGYGHLGAYGQQDIQTPHLDQLARDGAKFTQFYSGAPWCPPARKTLMTGLHAGHTPNRDGSRFEPDTELLPRSLKNAGYRTGLFGKWGLNTHENGQNIEGPSPMNLGFDEFAGYITHRDAHVYYLDGTAANGHNPVVQNLYEGVNGSLQPLHVGPDRYLPDEFLDRALGFIERNQNEPFFLYFPSQLPHAELVAPPSGLGPYAVNGQSIFPEERFAGNRTYPEPVDQPYATLAAMITRFDRDVGQIVAKIDALGLAQDTLIIVTSDNGPHEAGGIVHAGLLNGAGNLDGRKFHLYEGGIRVPMIARWTGTTPAGIVITDPHALYDFAPTFRDIANAPNMPSDGLSLQSKLRGQGGPNHETLYWENRFGGMQSLRTATGYLNQHAALRKGNHKIIRYYEQDVGDYVHVYDISGPAPDESNGANLAANSTNCALVIDLIRRMNESHNAVPGWAFHPIPELCQMLGDEGDNTLNGTGQGERILGRAGNDSISGFDGDDIVFGGPGDDHLNGNIGDDFVQGNIGNDIVHGGKNNDVVRGGKNNDMVYGDLGDDEVYGDMDDDQVFGGAGRDLVHGGQGNDVVHGNEDDDEVYGDDGNDRVFGNDGNDFVQGNMGDDYVQGNAGNDTVRGGKDDDEVRGGRDDDMVYGDLGSLLYGDLGTDVIYPGAGDDVVVFRGGDGYDVIYPDGSGNDTLRCEKASTIAKMTAAMVLHERWWPYSSDRTAQSSTIDRFEGC